MRARKPPVYALWAALVAILSLLAGPLSPAHAERHDAVEAAPMHAMNVAGSMAGDAAKSSPCHREGATACAWNCVSACQLMSALAPAVVGPQRPALAMAYGATTPTLVGVVIERSTPPPR